MEVVLVRWPEEGERLRRLRRTSAPRLLLLDGESPPPDSTDCLEDWVRLPNDMQDMGARMTRLLLRAQTAEVPVLDVDGLLRHRGCWVALSPAELALAGPLVDQFGAVVDRDTLARRASPGSTLTADALRVYMLRLRRRVASLGLEVRTVWSRGYLMQATPPRADI